MNSETTLKTTAEKHASELSQIVSSASREPSSFSGNHVAPQGQEEDLNSSGSSSGSPPHSPSREERKPLRVDFSSEDCYEMENKRANVERDLKKISRKGTGSIRYMEPRMSLLGKPLNYRNHRKDIRTRKIQTRIYNFLERPKIWPAVVYHLLMFFIVVSCLVLSVFATIENEHQQLVTTIVLHMEPVLLFWLIAEYTLRVWAAGCRSRYQGRMGRLRFIRRPLCIIDMVIIVSCIIVLLVVTAFPSFATSPLCGLRFFQILRMARIDRRGGTWKLLGSVVWAHRQELLTTLYIGLLGLLFSSFLVYLAESGRDEKKFRNFADALWWGVITLCTVGYGDVVPKTWAGKLIASFSAVLGISFFALPAGILGSGFALKVQQQQRQKHLIRRRVPAAMLIQSLWRCYAADECSLSIATWKVHMVPCPSPSSERNIKSNPSSFVSRFSTRRRDRCGSSVLPNSSHSPVPPRRDNDTRKCNGQDQEEFPNAINRSHLSLATGVADYTKAEQITHKKESCSSPSYNYRDRDPFEDEQDHSPKTIHLTEQHKKAIRAIRKIRYFVARKKFREALRPYDVKDVIEQYSAGHVDMLSRIKTLQFRLDQILGKQGSKKLDVYDSKQSLASRVVKVERSTEDIESKLDLLIDLYKEDRKILMSCYQYIIKNNGDSSPALNSHEVTSCLKNSSALKQPRSLLVEKSNKQLSEPCTPTLRHEGMSPALMQRNLSDLSQRIKKRVTYRLLSLNTEEHKPPDQFPPEVTYKGRRKSASFDTGDEIIIDNKKYDRVPSPSLKEENSIDSNSGKENNDQEKEENSNLSINSDLTETTSVQKTDFVYDSETNMRIQGNPSRKRNFSVQKQSNHDLESSSSELESESEDDSNNDENGDVFNVKSPRESYA